MKTKKTLIVTTVLFFLLLIGVGCEKESSETDFMKQKLAGTWEWIASYGGAIGETKPKPFEKNEITFTNDRVLIIHNSEVIQDGSYILNKENGTYYITITPKEGLDLLTFLSGKKELLFNETFDTLGFGFSMGTAHFSYVYKKTSLPD